MKSINYCYYYCCYLLILLYACNTSSEYIIDKPIEVREVIDKIESSNIQDLSLKKEIISTIEEQNIYSKKCFQKIKEIESKIEKIEIENEKLRKENEELKRELEFYNNVKLVLYTIIITIVFTQLFNFLFPIIKKLFLKI